MNAWKVLVWCLVAVAAASGGTVPAGEAPAPSPPQPPPPPPPANATTGDAYLDDAQAACYASRSTLDCLKFRALKYVYAAAQPSAEPVEVRVGGGGVRLVSTSERGAAPRLLGDAEPRAGDSELDKAFRFALRRLEAWVRSRALVVELPHAAADGARADDPDAPRLVTDDGRPFIEEARGKKKKLALLLPLALFFKLKALLLPILLGVLVIKKMLIVAAVLLPSLLGLVKICKPTHHYGGGYSVHTSGDWATGAGSEYSPAYGYGPHDSSRRHAMNAAYRAYAPSPGA